MASPNRHARLNPLGSSAFSLHDKTFAVDGIRAFVGSFNFDPRSALLNTEKGAIIDSPMLARQIDQAFDELIPAKSYRVQLSNNSELQWQSSNKDRNMTPITFLVEPKQ